MQDAYEENVVIHNYREVIEEAGLDEESVADPTDEFIARLNEQQIIACIAWHFRRDHFAEGSLISDSIGNGRLLQYFHALIGDC